MQTLHINVKSMATLSIALVYVLKGVYTLSCIHGRHTQNSLRFQVTIVTLEIVAVTKNEV